MIRIYQSCFIRPPKSFIDIIAQVIETEENVHVIQHLLLTKFRELPEVEGGSIWVHELRCGLYFLSMKVFKKN